MKLLPNISPSLKSKSKSGRGTGEKQDGKIVCLSAGISERGRGHREGGFVRGSSLVKGVKHIEWCVCVCVCDCTLSSSGRQRGTLCSSLTMVIKSLSCRSSSLVLHRDRG